MCQVIVETCAFAGSGEVLKVQQLLHYCDEHVDATSEAEKKEAEAESSTATGGAGAGGTMPGAAPAAPEADKDDEKPKVDDSYQAFAVLGIALVAMGEDVGAEMSLRQFGHLVSMTL